MSRAYCQHVHITCTDMAGMVAFWERGFAAVVEEYRTFSGVDGAILDIGMSAKLYLKKVPCEHIPDGPRRSGLEHLGMIVEDLDASLKNLALLPDTTVLCQPFLSPPVRCAYVQGPEGVMVEVMEYLPPL